MDSPSCLAFLTLVLAASALPGCGGNATSNSGATTSGGSPSTGGAAGSASGSDGTGGSASGSGGTGGTASDTGGSGGTASGNGGSGGATTPCTVGADQTCNDSPIVSAVWGHCQAGTCQCNADRELNPSTGKCRIAGSSACYSPTQNLDSAYETEPTGCACDAAVDRDTCRTDSGGRLVSLICETQRWWAVFDGPCSVEAATISLERSLCFGGCPSYRVTLTSDGLVSYDGLAFVLVHGAASHRIAPSAVRALAEEMENAHYFELSVPDECPSGISTDAPTVTTSLSRYGQTHQIPNYHGNSCAPPVLTTLEQRIDEVAGTSEWVACPPDGFCQER